MFSNFLFYFASPLYCVLYLVFLPVLFPYKLFPLVIVYIFCLSFPLLFLTLSLHNGEFVCSLFLVMDDLLKIPTSCPTSRSCPPHWFSIIICHHDLRRACHCRHHPQDLHRRKWGSSSSPRLQTQQALQSPRHQTLCVLCSLRLVPAVYQHWAIMPCLQ